MKVITENEILVTRNAATLPAFWSSADGKLAAKAKGLIGSGKVSGILDTLKGGSNMQPISSPPPPPTPPAKKGMKPALKWGLIIGGGIVLIIGGVLLYKKIKKK